MADINGKIRLLRGTLASFAAGAFARCLRLITARASRLGVEPGALLTTQLREMVMDEAGVRWALTEEATAAAEERAADVVAKVKADKETKSGQAP